MFLTIVSGFLKKKGLLWFNTEYSMKCNFYLFFFWINNFTWIYDKLIPPKMKKTTVTMCGSRSPAMDKWPFLLLADPLNGKYYRKY